MSSVIITRLYDGKFFVESNSETGRPLEVTCATQRRAQEIAGKYLDENPPRAPKTVRAKFGEMFRVRRVQ